jgi:hypothetical protein
VRGGGRIGLGDEDDERRLDGRLRCLCAHVSAGRLSGRSSPSVDSRHTTPLACRTEHATCNPQQCNPQQCNPQQCNPQQCNPQHASCNIQHAPAQSLPSAAQ